MTALTPAPGRFQLVPALDPEHYAALYDDIKAAGVRVPIDVDEQGNILDGHHRKAIAEELGKECPERVVFGLHSDEAKEDYAITVNGARRQMSAEKRRELATTSLKTHTRLSDREHARRCGVSHTYIANLREVLELAEVIAPAPSRQRRGGGEYPADRLATVANPEDHRGSSSPGEADGSAPSATPPVSGGTGEVGRSSHSEVPTSPTEAAELAGSAPDAEQASVASGTAAEGGLTQPPSAASDHVALPSDAGPRAADVQPSVEAAGADPAPAADLRTPHADPEREKERLAARDRDAGRSAASRIVPDIQTAVVSIGIAVKLGEPDLITADMVRQCREAVDFLEAIFKGEK